MFKKKKREESLRRRPDIHADRARPAFSYHAQRQRRDDGPARDRLRYDDSLRLDAKAIGFSQRIYSILGNNILLAIATIFLLLLLMTNVFVAVNNPIVVVHGTSDQRILLAQKEHYAKTAESVLVSSVSYRIKLFADTNAFDAVFTKRHPEVAHARLQLPIIGQRPEIHVTPAAPVLQLTSSRGELFAIDTSGRAVQAARSGQLALPRVQDDSGFAVNLGSQALSSQDVRFVQRLDQQLAAKNVSVDMYRIGNGSRQLTAHVKGKSYTIKFTFENDVLQQAGAYIATQQKLDALKVTPSEYVDVRVGDRVFYK